MYTLTASIVWGVLQPSNLIAILAVLGLLAGHTGRTGKACKLGGAAATLLVLLGVLPVGELMIKPLEARFERPDPADQVNGIIVLSGPEAPVMTTAHDVVTLRDSSGRLTTALALARIHATVPVVLTGGWAADGISQADVAARFLSESGIDPDRLIIERNARDTYENAVLSRELTDPDADARWLLVTSAFHMPRSVAAFDGADWDIIPYPTDYRSMPGSKLDWEFNVAAKLRIADLAVHEWVGLITYRILGRSRTLFPSDLETL